MKEFSTGDNALYAGKKCVIRLSKGEKGYFANHFYPPATGEKTFEEWSKIIPGIKADHDYIISIKQENGDFAGLIGVYAGQLEPTE